MWLLLHLLASLSLDLGSLPRLAIRESHLCLSTVSHLPASSLAPLVLLFVPWSIPSLTLPCLSSYQLSCCSCWSAIPVFLSLSPLISPSCYSTFSDNFLFSNSSLEFTTWRGSLSVLSIATTLFDSAPSVLTTSILDLLQIFFFQLQIQFLALLTCFADHLQGAQLPVSHF